MQHFLRPAPPRFPKTRKALSGNDISTFASAIGALQLVPDNAAILWRLGAAACLISEQPQVSDPETPDRAALASLLGEGEIPSAAAMMEDPREDLFTEEILTHGGTCLVGSGLDMDAVYVMRLFLSAFVQNKGIPATVRRELHDMEAAVSTISHAVFSSAGLERNIKPAGDRELCLPNGARMRRLQQAVTFGPTRLKRLLGPLVPALEPFTVEAGSEQFTDDEIMQGPAWRHPLVRVGDYVIVHRPHGLMASLRHQFALRVVAEIGEEAAAKEFSEVVVQDVHRSLRTMDWDPEDPIERESWVEIRSRIDRDKVAVAFIAADDFTGIEDKDPFGTWGTPEIATMFDERFREVATEITERGDTPFGLFVVQPAGRSAWSPLAGKDMVSVGLSAADLEVVALDEPGDALNLWKFARAMSSVEADRILVWSSLDAYAVYRSQNDSVEMWRGATMVNIAPGSGTDLRIEMKVKRDRHGAIYPNGAFVEVERASRDEAELGHIYRPTSSITPGRMAMHVDGGPVSFWVVEPVEHAELAHHAVNTVAYWVAEIVPEIEDALVVLRSTTRAIRFDVEIADPESWKTDEPQGAGLGSMELVDKATVRLNLGAQIAEEARRSDNLADRRIVSSILEALENVAAEALFSDRDAIIDRVAPLGAKKHLIMFAVDDHPMMIETDRPARGIKPGDESSARFALGARMKEKFGLETGPIDSHMRDDVLKEAVAFLFQEVETQIAEVDGDDLLEEVMRENERAIASSQRQLTMLPMREATYPLSRETLRDDIAEANRVSICLRFLVEYIAAQPPTGNRPWSLTRLDAVLPYIAEILDWGALDDAVHFNLTQSDLLINDEGQLRLVELDRYHEGRGGLFEAHVEDQRAESTRRWLDESDRDGDANRNERIDALMKAESGATLEEIGLTLIAANHEAAARDIDVVRIELDEAVEAIAARWNEPDPEVVRAAIDYMSMSPREKFLDPPSGGRLATYPWLNARRWSYNRRPFLRDAQGHVLWGRRHVLGALQIMAGQIYSGKYQALAETKALRKELGRLAKAEGRAFEDRVFALFDEAPGLPTKQRVTALGGDKLERPGGQTLGDIDVLVADPATKRLWALECKDLSGTQTTAEIAREISEHFSDEGTSSVSKHAERVDWLGARVPAALVALGLDGDPTEWQADGLIVTGRRVAAPYIGDVRFEVVIIDDIVERLRELGRE